MGFFCMVAKYYWELVKSKGETKEVKNLKGFLNFWIYF